MKRLTSVFFTLSVLAISVLNHTAAAQQLPYVPGPANLDTSRFAHIYFLRDTTDELPDNWFGVIMNNDAGLCVKIKMNSIYRVNTVRTGKNTFWTELGGVKESVTLELFPGSSYHIEIRPEKTGKNVMKSNLKLLKDEAAKARIAAFDGKVQERYMIMPYPSDQTDFTQNIWADTVQFYADKNSRYRFLPLPSWESILASPLMTVYGFRNKEISQTYSEAGGMFSLSLKKCENESAFDDYCKKQFVKSNFITIRDSITHSEVKPLQLPEGIKYARLVTVDGRPQKKKNPDEPQLSMRTCFVVFCWVNSKGKLKSGTVYTSERGLAEELHSAPELERRMKWLWDSFGLFVIPAD
ncbi:MAG: hypothetical protein RL213_2022 [Bacteroidota bacterium]|jgi:hypothetical protein